MSIAGKIPVHDLAPEIAEVRPALDAAWARVLASTQFILGPEVDAFEEEMAAYLGVKHAVGVASGTDAIVLALRGLGVGPGDEVVTTPFTFFATAEAISAVGARPVFADIDPDTFNLSADLAARAVGPRTKAIVPVHLFGHAADMDSILALGQERGITILEDAAQALGGQWRGRKLGTLGNAGAYSFFPSKNLGGFGDGGLVSTDDDEVAKKVRMLRAHGARRKYYNEVIGYNSRLDSLHAALLRVKLPHLDAWNEGRRNAAALSGTARRDSRARTSVGATRDTSRLPPVHGAGDQREARLAEGRTGRPGHGDHGLLPEIDARTAGIRAAWTRISSLGVGEPGGALPAPLATHRAQCAGAGGVGGSRRP